MKNDNQADTLTKLKSEITNLDKNLNKPAASEPIEKEEKLTDSVLPKEKQEKPKPEKEKDKKHGDVVFSS